MHLIAMGRVVSIVADGVFPESPLPDPPLAAGSGPARSASASAASSTETSSNGFMEHVTFDVLTPEPEPEPEPEPADFPQS
ncbi:MAG: hypothetical protein WAS73_09455 [Defluviicoccus sp.]